MKTIPALRIMLQPGCNMFFVVIGLSACPFTCILMLIIGIVRIVCCIVVRYKVHINKKLVPDPFKKMIEVPSNGCLGNNVNNYYSITPIEFSQRLLGWY